MRRCPNQCAYFTLADRCAGLLTKVVLAALSGGLGLPAGAAYISEIDRGGPGGRGIELMGLDPDAGATLLFIDANPYLPQAFGKVLDTLYVPGSVGVGGVAMVTESAWPGRDAAFVTLDQAAPASGDDELNLFQNRLLVVMNGQSRVQRLDQPLASDPAAARYDPTAVTDWLVLGGGGLAGLYRSRGHDIDLINQALGVSLLDRLVDKDAGRVVGRTHAPGQEVDMDTFFVGAPGDDGRFAVDVQHDYVYTPGFGNWPLLAAAPEPSALALLAAGLALGARRARRG